jgi:hypothetical protein
VFVQIKNKTHKEQASLQTSIARKHVPQHNKNQSPYPYYLLRASTDGYLTPKCIIFTWVSHGSNKEMEKPNQASEVLLLRICNTFCIQKHHFQQDDIVPKQKRRSAEDSWLNQKASRENPI